MRIEPHSLRPGSQIHSVIKTVLPVFLSLAWALLLACAASAQSMEQADSAYAEGRFAAAAELAEELQTSEGYALAALALVMHGHLSSDTRVKEPLYKRAIRLAKRAIRLNPRNPEAHIQLAHAMGRYARAIGFVKAVAGGYARKVRKAIDKALRLDPDKAGAHLSMATWHSELVKGAGPMAGLLYGATAKKARKHYRRSIELVPYDKVARVEYAFALLTMDKRRHHAEALHQLEHAVQTPPRNAVDRLYHEKALARLAVLNGS